jgi:putative ABC transport system permease protein
LLITSMFLPQAAKWLNIKINIDLLAQPSVIIMVVILTLAVILLAGLYLAFVQSAFRPIESLKSKATLSFKGD